MTSPVTRSGVGQRAPALLVSAGAGAVWLLEFLWARGPRSDPSAIAGALEWASPAACAASATVALLAALLCIPRLRGDRVRAHEREGLLLAGVVVSGLLVRLTLVPATERVYYDEHAYRQLARAIGDEGRARAVRFGVIEEGRLRSMVGSYAHWSLGCPTLLAGAGRLTGYARATGPAANLLLSLATVGLVAAIAAILVPGPHAWLAGAMAYVALPANQVWSRTSAPETLSAFAVTLAVLCVLAFSREPGLRRGCLAAGAVALAAETRNEMILAVPLAALIVACAGGGRALRAAWLPAALLGLLLIPQAAHLGLVSRTFEAGTGEGPGLSVSYVGRNLAAAGRYLTHEPVALLAVIAGVIGASVLRAGKAAVPLYAWAGIGFVPPMLHFGGSYAFPGGERFALAWMPPVALLAGAGLCAVDATLARRVPRQARAGGWCGVFVAAMLWAGPHARLVDAATRIPREDCTFLREALREVPPDGVVVTADPPVVIAEGRSAVSVTWVAESDSRLRNLQRRGSQVYLFKAPSSLPSQWVGGLEAERRLMARFAGRVLREQQSADGRRVLYRLLPGGSEP